MLGALVFERCFHSGVELYGAEIDVLIQFEAEL